MVMMERVNWWGVISVQCLYKYLDKKWGLPVNRVLCRNNKVINIEIQYHVFAL